MYFTIFKKIDLNLTGCFNHDFIDPLKIHHFIKETFHTFSNWTAKLEST